MDFWFFNEVFALDCTHIKNFALVVAKQFFNVILLTLVDPS